MLCFHFAFLYLAVIESLIRYVLPLHLLVVLLFVLAPNPSHHILQYLLNLGHTYCVKRFCNHPFVHVKHS